VCRRYLSEVGKFLSYFVASLSKTLHISFRQLNRSSIVEVMIKNHRCVFYAPLAHSVVEQSDA